MLEEEDPAYDPRGQLNMEAAKLYWGSKDEKKEYNKRLRRFVGFGHPEKQKWLIKTI